MSRKILVGSNDGTRMHFRKVENYATRMDLDFKVEFAFATNTAGKESDKSDKRDEFELFTESVPKLPADSIVVCDGNIQGRDEIDPKLLKLAKDNQHVHFVFFSSMSSRVANFKTATDGLKNVSCCPTAACFVVTREQVEKPQVSTGSQADVMCAAATAAQPMPAAAEPGLKRTGSKNQVLPTGMLRASTDLFKDTGNTTDVAVLVSDDEEPVAQKSCC